MNLDLDLLHAGDPMVLTLAPDLNWLTLDGCLHLTICGLRLSPSAP
jgi:hypothetical protein